MVHSMLQNAADESNQHERTEQVSRPILTFNEVFEEEK